MLTEIQAELQRISADDVVVSLDADFEPKAGTLVKVVIGDAYWHLLPDQFLELLQGLAPDAGNEGVRIAIEQKASFVWHGPSPKNSRDTSP